jgi:hypothetical protein
MKIIKFYKKIIWSIIFFIFLMTIISFFSEYSYQYSIIQQSINDNKRKINLCKVNPEVKEVFNEECFASKIIDESLTYQFTEPIKIIYLNMINEGGILSFVMNILQIIGISNYNYLLLFGIILFLYFYKIQPNNNNNGNANTPLVILDSNGIFSNSNSYNDKFNKLFQRKNALPNVNDFGGVVTSKYNN